MHYRQPRYRLQRHKNLRRGIFPSVPDLIASIDEYLNAHNANPTPYAWTATAESILAKVQRARTKLDQVVNQKSDTPPDPTVPIRAECA